MIYSPDIEKKCLLCVNARIVGTDDTEFIICTKKNKPVELNQKACRKFRYDIFKKEVKRRKTYIPDVSPEELTIE